MVQLALNPKIISEDDTLLILDKPSGWITNLASTTKDQPVIQDWVRKNIKSGLIDKPDFRDGIVHRLDKETSGLLIIAKTKTSFTSIQKQFKERKVSKTYKALAHGIVDPKGGTIQAPVGRLPWRRDRFGVLAGGRPAITGYIAQSYFQGADAKGNSNVTYSLVRLSPKTGRTHQIRIHLKHIGHSVVSDEFYAGRKTARDDRKWCPRLFLHAEGIKFTHPDGGKMVNYKSELPEDLQSALGKLEPFTD